MHQPVPQTMAELLDQFPRDGKVEWIGIRTERRMPLKSVRSVAVLENGLEGDHRQRPGRRAVSLIQAEHLSAIAAMCGLKRLDAATLRRNILVSGINLIALKDKTFRVGDVVLRGTGPCAPCSRMEELLGPGGYNAMRGHGGLTAEVVEPGTISLGDRVGILRA